VVPSSTQLLGIHRMGADVRAAPRSTLSIETFEAPPFIETCTVPEDKVGFIRIRQHHMIRAHTVKLVGATIIGYQLDTTLKKEKTGSVKPLETLLLRA
jgi:hypothetical protein